MEREPIDLDRAIEQREQREPIEREMMERERRFLESRGPFELQTRDFTRYSLYLADMLDFIYEAHWMISMIRYNLGGNHITIRPYNSSFLRYENDHPDSPGVLMTRDALVAELRDVASAPRLSP
jgi:hypothetical protein